MNQTSAAYRLLSAVLSFLLLAQGIAPALFLPPTAHAAPLPPPAQGPAREATTTTTPSAYPLPSAAAAAAPALALSRVQSAYTAPGAVVITYTVRNTLPPLTIPPLPATFTLTDTIAALAGFDPLADPNTVRNVLLTTDLTGVGALDAAQPPASRQGTSLAWNLGDLAPGQSTTAVLSLTIPTTPATFDLLDAGAAAHGHVAGRAVSATAAPALVNTPSLAQWLVWTMDADLYDADMLAAAGQLGHDPARLFAYVRGLGYEAYDGSLRGTRGTLWSAAGNSADQASLLIAMLRASGIPARYRHGTLSAADAQTLIASIFPTPTRLVGRLDPALQTADPVNDPALIAQVQDHWWVEAFLPGSGWTNLDPSFPTAAIGDAFATPASDGTDRIAELPDAVRHKVTIRVKVEAYHPLNLGQSGLDVSYPLDHTFRSVELTTAPVAVAHFVESESQGGLVFANTIHTYTPYLLLGETQIVGQPYQDLLTNFPLGTTFHTAVWIEFDLTTPAGDTSSYVREVVDRIGYEARVNGGNSSLALAGDGSQLVTDFDVYATGFWPHVVPTSAVERAKADTLAQVGRMQADGERLAELAALPSLTPAELTEAAQLRGQVQYDLAAYLGSLALAFADSADQVLAATAPASLVRAYYAAPRLITAGVEPGAADTTFTIDLRHTAARVLPYPGQPAEAAVSYNVVKGILESGLEGATLDSATGQTSLTTAGLFSAASDQGIASVTITPDNLDLLDELNISAVARARITTAAAAHGKLVIVPAEPVLIAGTAQFGWWEIDIASGETIGLLDNGLHNAIIEFTVGMIIGAISGPFVDFMIGIGAYALGFAASNATKVLGGPVLDLGAYKDHVSSASTTLSCALPWTGAYGAGGCAGLYDYFGLGMKAAEGLLSNIQGADPPISSFPLGVITPPTPPSIVSGTLAVAPTLPAGTLNASLTTDFTAVSGTLAASHASPGAAYRYDSLTLASGTLKDAAGATIGSGAIAAAGPGLLTATAADVTLSGAGQMGFYAAPLPAIGSASYFDAAQVTLSGSSLVLTLPDTAVSLDGVTYSGRFTVEANAPVTLSGAGPVADASHAASAALNGSGLALLLGPAGGSATLGGQPLDVSAGLALAGYSGAVTLTDGGSAQQVALDGAADLFRVTTSPPASSTAPDTAVSFTAAVASNFGADFHLTLSAPEGWTVALNGAQAGVTPAPGAAAGVYDVTLTACPAAAPLVCQTAAHAVTVQPFDGFAFSLRPDPLTTMPMGPVLAADARPDSTNTGQAQVPGAAYHLVITNTANAAHTYTVTVGGLPAGWTLLANRAAGDTTGSLALPPGEVGYLGLYVNPTSGQLPAPGASYPIQVTAVSDTGAQQTDTAQFTMPAVPFNYVAVQPPVVTLTGTATAAFDLSVTNVGNAAGSFPIAARDAFAAVAVTAPPAGVVNLPPGATDTQTVAVSTSGAPVGAVFPVYFDSPAPGGVYTQTAALLVRVASQRSGQILQAGRCGAGSAAFPASIESLGDAVQELERWCALGDCPLPLRDQTVTAAREVARAGGQVPFTTAAPGVTAAADQLAAQSGNPAILAALDGLATAVSTLGSQVCEVEEHRPTLRWNPVTAAVLTGGSAGYDLEISNAGTVATTYAVTLTLPAGDTVQNVTIPAGQTTSLPVTVSTPPAGYHLLAATAVPTAPAVQLPIAATTQARLNVVDRFVQVTAVTANPSFVDTGVSSTTLSVEIANVANVPLTATAETAVVAPGGLTQAALSPVLNLLAGSPRTYTLGTLDTSGWAEGTYTVTVRLLDGSGALLPDGAGRGYLGVGQTLAARMSAAPLVLPPGTVTVTTVLTTEIGAASFFTGPLGFGNAVPGDPAPFVEPTPAAEGLPDVLFGPSPAPADALSEEAPMRDEPTAPLAPSATGVVTISAGLIRYEETAAGITTSGAWNATSAASYSGGAARRSEQIGATAVFTFTGEWLEIGLNRGTDAGKVDVTIDGISQGAFDLYGRHETRSLVFPGLGAGQHVVTLTVLPQDNPLSSRGWVALDYLTVWDGTAVPDGAFEHDDPRVLTSNGWSTANDANASGGTYGWRADKAWFYFSGDSVTLRVVTDASWDEMRLLVDGQFVTKFDLYRTDVPTDTLSLGGFGPGLHVLELDEYRGSSTLDTLTTPGVPPFFTPPAAAYTRYEEDDSALRYNGLPFAVAANTWGTESASAASNAYAAWSDTLSDTVSLTFTGTAVFLGFYTDDWGGLAQVSLDGVVQETVDTYSNEPDLLTRRYAGLSAGPHTITVTVLDARNPFALRDRVRLDFVDVWDGAPLPDGAVEAEDRSRVYTSDNWTLANDAGASGGSFAERGDTLWYPFTGDSVRLTLPNNTTGREMRLFVDDQFVDFLDVYSATFLTETISLDGLGSGVHLLRLEAYRGRALADTFATPGAAPFWQPPVKSGYFRYEEDDPDLRYDGAPFWQSPTTWSRGDGVFSLAGSDGQLVDTSAVSSTLSLTFSGEWVSLGFLGGSSDGQIEVWLDGVSQGVYDLYRHDEDPVTIQFGNLGGGTHTVTAVNLGTRHPNSSGTRMRVDYVDVWDGTPLPAGLVEAEDASRAYYSGNLGITNEPAASGGAYVRDGLFSNASLWFPFTGDSITLQSWANSSWDEMRIRIDGVEQPRLDLFSTTAQTRTISFSGLGAGVHLLELTRYRSDMTADAFIMPAVPANFIYPPPPQTGIVRYEEDHPALRYNGYPYSQTVGSWTYDSSFNISGDFVARTSVAGNSVTLDFSGSWFGVGFQSTSQTGVAEVYLNGQLLDSVDTSGNQGPISRYYSVVTGTHTISVTAVNRIEVDFIDVWDGTPMPAGWHEADLNDRAARFHYTTYWATYGDEYARGEEMVGRGLVNTRRTVWFSFTGSDLTFRSYNDNNGQYEIFIDGVSQGVYTTTATFSNQPINWHFQNLGAGPHVFSLLAIDGSSRTFVDAFEVDPASFVTAAPVVEWFDFTTSQVITTANGFVSTMAAGDINQDGIVEIIAPSTDGNLYVYRGDGQDAGGGSPIIWSAQVGVANEPSIADIDLDGYGEVLVLGGGGLFAFEHDGATKWMTATLASAEGNSYGWGGVAVGNLDLDDAPELVVAPRQQQAAVVSADGAQVTRFGPTLGDFPTLPILADLNGDGFLDIIYADDDTLYTYDAFNGLNQLWAYTYDTSDIAPNTGSQTWGPPAVANLDADADPEIIMFFEEKVVALHHDGTELWVYKVDRANGYRPSHVTVADVDGDQQVEIIVSQALSAGFVVINHEILVLNADGTLLWSEIVAESTGSSSGVATHDFNGDGVWEVLWNGYTDGFLIFNGPDGDRIYNEPRINSGTIIDYPAVVDADGDGHAEVLLGDHEGLWVVGHDGVWADSRPLWSGNAYRITDLNDNLSVPVNEPPSWLVHNTYRTQTPERSPAPAYGVGVAYAAGPDQITVLTPTLSLPPTAVSPPTYTFGYQQAWYQPVITLTFVSEVANLQPGEVRQLAAGALVSYTLPGGRNQLRLPPLYVTGAAIAALTPAAQTAVPGQRLSYTLTLRNPAAAADTYGLALAGLPSDWGVALPASVGLPASGQVTATLALTVPTDAELRSHPFVLAVTTGSGGTAQLGGEAAVQAGLALTIAAAGAAPVAVGQAVSHTLTVHNLESAARTYDLSGSGAPQLALPAVVTVPGGGSAAVPFTAAPGDTGPQPFTVAAVARESGAAAAETAVVQGAGRDGVFVSLAPAAVEAGPGGTAVFTVSVQNLGTAARVFDLSAALPAGWAARFEANAQPVDAVFVATGVYSAARLTLIVTPAETAVGGSYAVDVTAAAQGNSAVAHTAVGQVNLAGHGVQVEILDDGVVVNPDATATWDVRVTNTGGSGDSFDLTAAGIALGAGGAFSSAGVTLAAGAATVVQFTAGPFLGAAPRAYDLSVLARSSGSPAVVGEDRTTFEVAAQAAVAAAWLPADQTISDTFSAGYTLWITNTGNVATTYSLALSGAGLLAAVPLSELPLAPGMAVVLPVAVRASGPGTFTLTATAVGGGTQASATATLQVNVGPRQVLQFLPISFRR